MWLHAEYRNLICLKVNQVVKYELLELIYSPTALLQRKLSSHFPKFCHFLLKHWRHLPELTWGLKSSPTRSISADTASNPFNEIWKEPQRKRQSLKFTKIQSVSFAVHTGNNVNLANIIKVSWIPTTEGWNNQLMNKQHTVKPLV